MSIIVSGVSHHFENNSPLFPSVSFAIGDGQKASVIGNNGSGKSTLLRIIAGELTPALGSASHDGDLYYVPQLTSSHFHTIADALGVSEKTHALHAILNGDADERNYEIVGDDWDIEERCLRALADWSVRGKTLVSDFEHLSGGEKTKILLAGIGLHHSTNVLLDEPTNHLDIPSRQRLYQWVKDTKATLLVVSHDESLLNLMDSTMELSSQGLHIFGGNYDAFKVQQDMEAQALQQQIDAGWASLKAMKRKAQVVRERQEQRTAQGSRNGGKGGQARILLNAKGSEAQTTAARLNGKQQDKLNEAWQHIQGLKARQQPSMPLRVDLEKSQLHNGKCLIKAENVNYAYGNRQSLWTKDIDMEIRSGERWWLRGENGSGKTTLLRLLLGMKQPSHGTLNHAEFTYNYIDQEYSEVTQPITVLELAMQYNRRLLPEHEVCLLLNRSLFPQESWKKICTTLSGGERMRLFLCCMMIANQQPDVFVLDEPSNNLDMQSKKILADTIKNYHGTVIIVSHDERFVNYIGIDHQLQLEKMQ